MDNRRVYEIYPGTKLESIRDFENRTMEPGDQSLTITGAPAHIILRWRFAGPRATTVNGRGVPVARQADGTTVEFDHTGTSSITWR
jgi:hypothetical protein